MLIFEVRSTHIQRRKLQLPLSGNISITKLQMICVGRASDILLLACFNKNIFTRICIVCMFQKVKRKKQHGYVFKNLHIQKLCQELIYPLLINLRFTFSSSTHRVLAHEIQEHLSCTCSPSNFHISIILHIVIKHYISQYSNYWSRML